MKELKGGETPSEELLRVCSATSVQASAYSRQTTKAGVAIGKLRNNPNAEISASAKDVVKVWREAVDEQKKKRKRQDGDDGEVKRTKTEDKGSSAASPASPSKEGKPRLKSEGSTDKVEQQQPLSTIDSTRKVPRTAKLDGMDGKLKASDAEAGDDLRDKCVVMMYDALAVDSTAGQQCRVVEILADGSREEDHRRKSGGH